jgi:glycosyltransferase involved in cell wall biosynthesis
MDDILETYPGVEFHFVGRGGEENINLIIEKQIKWGERVKHYPLTMEQMPQPYRNADISLIPSVHSEGTSLSCLEAMASGNAVIATQIGGLPDLIINNYNGFLIDPRSEELKQAIINLLNNRKQLNLFKKRNTEVAQAFSKNIWRNRWMSLLNNKIDKTH